MLWRCFLSAAVALPFAGAPGFAQDPSVQRANGKLAITARSILRKYCIECHNLTHAADPAHTGFSILNHQELVGPNAGRPDLKFVERGKPASHLIQLIESGTMPPGGRDRPTDAELKSLRDWIVAGAPSYPQAFDEPTTLKVMLGDFAGCDPNDKPYIRYISFAHLIVDGQAVPDIGALQADLQRALIDTTDMPVPVFPHIVDDTATLYRIDIRKLGWSNRDLFQSEYPTPNTAYPLTPYDLILLDYPYGFTIPNDNPESVALRNYLETTKPIRPVPFIRGDWLGKAIALDEPLATELKWLMELSQALQNKPGRSKLGPFQTPFAKSAALKLPPATPARRPILPLGSAHALDVATDPPPFAFQASVVMTAGKSLRTVAVNDPFRIEVESDANVHLTLINVMSNGEYRLLPFGGRTDLIPGKPRLLTPQDSGAFVVSSIDKGLDESMEYFIVIASQDPIPRDSMTIVRSRHTDYSPTSKKGPIWRLVFNPKSGTLDETRIIRKVIPLKITRN